MNIMEPSALAWDHWGFSDEEVAGGNGQSSEIRWERKVENDRIRKETKGMQMTNIPSAIIFFDGFQTHKILVLVYNLSSFQEVPPVL